MISFLYASLLDSIVKNPTTGNSGVLYIMPELNHRAKRAV